MKVTLLVHTGDHSKIIWGAWYRYYLKNLVPVEKTSPLAMQFKTVFLSEEESMHNALHIAETNLLSVATGKNKTWGEGLLHFLNQDNSDYIVYHHEDYFISDKVNLLLLEELAYTMKANDLNLLKCCGWWGGYIDANAPYIEDNTTTLQGKKLYRYNNLSQYLISHQSSLWDRKFLISTIDRNYSAWDHEIHGTNALRLRNIPIYAYREAPPIAYVETINRRRIRPNCEQYFTAEEIYTIQKGMRG